MPNLTFLAPTIPEIRTTGSKNVKSRCRVRVVPPLQGWIQLVIVHRVVSSETRTTVLYNIYTVLFTYNYLQLSSCMSDRILSGDLHATPSAC